jgi:hypothetical protein
MKKIMLIIGLDLNLLFPGESANIFIYFWVCLTVAKLGEIGIIIFPLLEILNHSFYNEMKRDTKC